MCCASSPTVCTLQEPSPSAPPASGPPPRAHEEAAGASTDEVYLDIEFSLTISAGAKHVPPAWFRALKLWLAAATIAGGCALERGGRQAHLHIQALFRKRVKDVEVKTINKIKADIRQSLSIMRGDPHRAIIQLKPFGAGQNWSMMLGYIHKDRGAPHFQAFTHEVPQGDVDKGIEEWRAARLTYEDDKILLNTTNFFQRLHAYYLSELACRSNASALSWLTVLTHMLNTGRYMLSSRMLMNTFGQMHYKAAEAYWFLVTGCPVTEDQVEAMVCVPRWKPYDPSTPEGRSRDKRPRYFEGSRAASPRVNHDGDDDEPFTADYVPLSTRAASLPSSAFSRRHANARRDTRRRIQLSDDSDEEPSSNNQASQFVVLEAEDGGGGMEEEEEESDEYENDFIDNRDDSDLSVYSD